MKRSLTVLLILLTLLASAQRTSRRREETPAKPEASPAPAAAPTPDYHALRVKLSVPPYGLDKVKGLIDRLKVECDVAFMRSSARNEP